MAQDDEARDISRAIEDARSDILALNTAVNFTPLHPFPSFPGPLSNSG